jgi:hypothetical protein
MHMGSPFDGVFRGCRPESGRSAIHHYATFAPAISRMTAYAYTRTSRSAASCLESGHPFIATIGDAKIKIFASPILAQLAGRLPPIDGHLM